MPNLRQKYLTESYDKAYRVMNFTVFFEEKEGHFNNHANAEIMFDLFSLDYTAGFDLNILDGYVFKIIDFLNKAYLTNKNIKNKTDAFEVICTKINNEIQWHCTKEKVNMRILPTKAEVLLKLQREKQA